MSQKDNLLDNPVEFLKEVRESFDIQQDVDAMKRIRHDLDVIKEESEARLKLYRSLGVILDLENDQVLINRKNDGNIDILPLDNNLSDFYKTKYIWERLGK
uniref:Spc24 n=2 Tax=Saccharomyces cerevisiae TaxID=4932 RepID=UPI0008FEAF05|nr:Chain C, Spc24 [Saccharomyces cerevisiae]